MQNPACIVVEIINIYIYRIINTHSNSTSMLYSPCCLTIIIYVWCYWPKLWMPTNPTSVWSGPVASHFSAATVGSFSLLHTSRIHPGNLTAKWWLEDLLNLLKWSFFRGIGRVEDIHMDIYMYIITILATLTNKNYQGQKEVTVKGAKKHQKNWGFLVKLKTPLTSEPSWPVFECFLLLRWWFELTNEAGFIRGTLGTGRRVGFLSQEVARPETPKEARVRATKNKTVTVSNIFQTALCSAILMLNFYHFLRINHSKQTDLLFFASWTSLGTCFLLWEELEAQHDGIPIHPSLAIKAYGRHASIPGASSHHVRSRGWQHHLFWQLK